MRFRAVFLRFGTARIGNGRVQTGNGVSGRLGEPATRARDRLLAGGDPSSGALNLSSLWQVKGSWNVVCGETDCCVNTSWRQHGYRAIRVFGHYGVLRDFVLPREHSSRFGAPAPVHFRRCFGSTFGKVSFLFARELARRSP